MTPSSLSHAYSTALPVIGSMVLALGTASAEIAPNDLLGYYPFDGQLTDQSSTVGGSSSANTGSWTGTSNYAAGIFGQAARVGNGSGSNYITIQGAEYAFDATGTNSFTILYWANVESNVSSDPVLIAGGGKNWSSSGGTLGWVSTIAGDDIKANISDGSTRKDTAWIDLDPDSTWGDNRDHWILVALVVDRTAQTLTNYVLDDHVATIGDHSSSPGSLSLAGLGSLTGAHQHIVIGQDGDYSGYGTSYPGLPATGIDDLSIWGRALSTVEIQEIYTEGRSGNPLGHILSGLTASLNESSGVVTLNWDAFDLAGLATPTIQVKRDGALLATLPGSATTYPDSPPAPRYTDETYAYQIELFDGSSPVADSSSSANVHWPLSGLIEDLNASLDSLAGTVGLSWMPAGSEFQADGIKIFREGIEIADLPLTTASYLDSPPPPSNIPVSYHYTVQAYGGWQGGAHTNLTTEVTWSPGGMAYGLIAEYRFENGFSDTASGPVVHDGTPLNGASLSGNGVSGHAVSFLDQLKQGIHVSDHPLLDFGSSLDFTISLWMKREGAMNTSLPYGEASDGVLLCKQDWSNGSNPGWGLYATADGGVQWNLAGSSRKSGTIASGASGLAEGVWHHIAVSNDRDGSAPCYVDGVHVKSIDISGAGSVDNTMPLSMGVDGNGTRSWKGSLDEVALWNKALNDTEIMDVYRSGKLGLALSGKGIVDSDGDGLSDDWERTHFGNLDQTATGDFDNDRRSNFLEFAQGSNPTEGRLTVTHRVTGEEFQGSIYPVLHYVRPTLTSDISYTPESSSDLRTWSGGDSKFIPFGDPVDVGNGLREYHLRFHQSIDTVASRSLMFRVRMESRYQGAIAEAIEPTVELRDGKATVIWFTETPSVTILDYGFDGQTAYRFEDQTLTTRHEVVIDDIDPGDAFSYTVIQVQDGVETRSNTFTTAGVWDYSPPPVPDQQGFDSGGGWAAQAEAILAQPGVLDRGYCLDYLCGDGRLAYELARRSQLVVIGVEDTQAEVNAARTFLVNRGVYGSRVTVLLASDLGNLPFCADFFNLIVSQSQISSATGFTNFKDAVEKHAIPARGKVVGLSGGSLQTSMKPSHPGTGVWTSSFGNPANTAASTEEFSGKTSMNDFELRWLGAPGPELMWDRQTAEQPPLAANGRFYCQGRGRLLALDSHNGSVLWTRELDDAQRFNLLRDAGNLSADNDAVWLALRKECWRMDGDTGNHTTYPLVEGPRADLDYSWNYVCSTGDHLLGSASLDEAYYKEHWGPQFWYTHAGGSLANQVVSDNLFSLDQASAALNWEYTSGLILSVTITVGDGKIFFLETRNASALSGNSRRLPTATWKTNLRLVCLDLETGAMLWDRPSSFTGGTQTVFLMYDSESDKLVLTSGDGSKNYLYAFNPANGTPLWNNSAACYKTDHGGKNQHAVITGGEILFTPHVYDINTGAILRSNIPANRGGGCNTYWGSKNLLFYRTGYSGQGLSMWPIQGGSATGIDHVKGACWLNWAPADGMFLIQEKSAGCSCGAWVHISQGWGPKN